MGRPKVTTKRYKERHKDQFGSDLFRTGDLPLFKVAKAGVRRISIIPFFSTGKGNPHCDKGDYHYERTYWSHRNIGPEGNDVICLKKTAKKECPICEWINTESRKANPDEDAISDLRPKERQLWLVFDHMDAASGVQLWEMSYHLFGKQLQEYVDDADPDDEATYQAFADPTDGSMIKVGFKEQKFKTFTYYETSSIEFKPRTKVPIPDELFDHKISLDDLLIVPSYAAVSSEFLGTANPDEESGSPSPAGQKSTKPNPTTEEDWDDDDDDTPVSAPAKTETTTVVDNDDDDDWGDDDDDVGEPAPTAEDPAAETETASPRRS
jgi:hypothetical protein